MFLEGKNLSRTRRGVEVNSLTYPLWLGPPRMVWGVLHNATTRDDAH